MRIKVIVNRGGGSVAGETRALEERIAEAFASAGAQADITTVSSTRLVDAFDSAAASGRFDILVAGGGDGTVGLAAAAASRNDMALGVLPLGTFNHLARDAGIPVRLEAAVAVITAGHTRAVDLAQVNDRIFVNNSAVGLYPLMVRTRDAQLKRFGRSKRWAMLVASIRALRHFSRYRLTIKAGDREQRIRTTLLFVGNNRYETRLFSLGRRAAIDRGELCLYALLARARKQVLGVGIRGIFGLLDDRRDFALITGIDHVEVESQLPALAVSADGEALQLHAPLRYRILPGALRLLVPEQAAEPESASGNTAG